MYLLFLPKSSFVAFTSHTNLKFSIRSVHNLTQQEWERFDKLHRESQSVKPTVPVYEEKKYTNENTTAAQAEELLPSYEDMLAQNKEQAPGIRLTWARTVKKLEDFNDNKPNWVREPTNRVFEEAKINEIMKPKTYMII